MNEPSAADVRPPGERETGSRVRAIALTGATAAGVFVCALVAAPFLGAITWAATLAILFHPLHAWIKARLQRRNLAASLSVLVVAVVVVVPVLFAAGRLVEEAATSVAFIQEKLASGAIQQLLDANPGVAPFARWIAQQIDLPTLMASLAAWLSNAATSFMRGSLLQVVEFLMTFYLLFFMFRDRTAALRSLNSFLPLSADESRRLQSAVVDTVRATIVGIVVVAAVQGTLGGAMFWILGLSTPLLWGLVMGLLAIVPVLGAFIIWIPAVILLALDGSWARAAILAIWGLVAVGGIDDVLRPVLVGNRIRMHPVPTFLSMIGGLILFGAPGVILGPIAFTTTRLLVEMWRADERARRRSARRSAANDRGTQT